MTTAEVDDPFDRAPAPGPVREAFTTLVSVFKSRSLRRIQTALAVSSVWDWAYATAVTVWAFGEGGAKAVGIWGAVRYTLMALFAPFAATLSDRFPRKAVMVGAEVLQMVVTIAAALCIAADTAAAPVYVLATICSLLGCVFRPAQMSLMPSIVSEPGELTASNGASSTIDSLSFFLGPALGAALVAAFSIEAVFFINAASFAVSSMLIASIHVPVKDVVTGTDDEEEEEPRGGALAGFATIWRDRDLLMVTGLVAAQTVVAGATLVLGVVFATQILEGEAESVGLIDSTLGVGAILGGLVAITLAARPVMARTLGIGVVLWSLPLLAVALWPEPPVMFVATATMGFGNPLVDVNYATLTQRLAPDEVLGRVFGAGEGILIATMAIGAAATPFLIEEVGLRETLAGVALVSGLPAVALFGRCRRLDGTMKPPAGLDLLRTIPIFSPLDPARLESLARRLGRQDVAAGSVVVSEGEVGNLFYVIERGAVQVSHGESVIRTEGVGDYFGEIALVRDIPRTATVTATEDTTLLTLWRDDFLDAISGADESRAAVHSVVARRILV